VVPDSRIRREYRITLGRLQGAAGKRNTADFADYILEYKGRMVAVIFRQGLIVHPGAPRILHFHVVLFADRVLLGSP
jgi:hypothetical protein